MKIAFAIMAHKYTPVLHELVVRLKAPDTMLLIHVDKKVDISTFAVLQELGVTFTKTRINVRWGN